MDIYSFPRHSWRPDPWHATSPARGRLLYAYPKAGVHAVFGRCVKSDDGPCDHFGYALPDRVVVIPVIRDAKEAAAICPAYEGVVFPSFGVFDLGFGACKVAEGEVWCTEKDGAVTPMDPREVAHALFRSHFGVEVMHATPVLAYQPDPRVDSRVYTFLGFGITDIAELGPDDESRAVHSPMDAGGMIDTVHNNDVNCEFFRRLTICYGYDGGEKVIADILSSSVQGFSIEGANCHPTWDWQRGTRPPNRRRVET